MPGLGSASELTRDIPVCFPGHPCVDYSPLEADAINITSGLTPVSQAMAVVCLAVLGIALVLILFGLRPRASRQGLWVVALSAALVLIGVVVAALAELRLSAIAEIFGLEGPNSPDLYGSWSLVAFAGEAMAVAGAAALTVTATIAVIRLRDLVRADELDGL